ncbi:MAG: MFS transporter [Saprospiraceae bacterium]|nr:MFS transporter [Saprospiraceae bacterium]
MPAFQLNKSSKLTLLLVSSLTIMSIITISPALPLISDHFKDIQGIDTLVKIMLTVPALFIAIISPIAGRLIDKIGRLKLLLPAMIFYAFCGSVGLYTESIYILFLSRIGLGIAVGVTMTIVVTLVADYFQGMERQKFLGLQIAFMSLAGIVFVGFGGYLSDINWRYPFALYLLALIVMPFAARLLPEPEKIIIDKEDKKMKAPLFIWLLFINTGIMWMIFFLIPVHLPYYLESMGIEQKSMVGLAIALSTLFSAVSSFLFFKIKERFSFQRIITMGYIIVALAFVSLYHATGFPMILMAMVLGGLGIGVMIPNINMWVMQLAPQEIRGQEIGKLTTFWFMGQFLSPIVSAPILGMIGLPATFLLVAVLSGLLAVAFLFIK